MPVHDLGYREWSGNRSARFLRPLDVARAGVSLIFKRKWIRLMVVMAWLPVIFPALGIFVFEYSASEPEFRDVIVQFAILQLGDPELAELIVTDHDLARHKVWSSLILAFFRYPQLFAMVVLIGLMAPVLVSYDLRTKAYLMYFSRPLTPSEYILGKSGVIWSLLGLTITVPACLLYLLGVLLSSDLSVISQTWDIPFRILGASVVLLVPTTMLAVLYSSLTAESRYATFAWFATWIMGSVAYQFLTFTSAAVAQGGRPPRPRRGRRGPPDLEAIGVDFDQWRWLSPYHILGKVEGWVFGLDPTSGSVIPSVLILLAVTAGGFWIVRRRLIARLSV